MGKRMIDGILTAKTDSETLDWKHRKVIKRIVFTGLATVLSLTISLAQTTTLKL